MGLFDSIRFVDPVSSAIAIVVATLFYRLFGWKKVLTLIPSELVIVITGCDSGFGYLTCQRLHQLGFVVVATCLTKDGLEKIKDWTSAAVTCDVTVPSDVRSLVECTRSVMKDRNCRLWAVVNNAGIAYSGGIDWISTKTCRRVMEVNYFGLFDVIQALLPLLKESKGSRIINISSAAGFSAASLMGVYCASKHAVEGLGKCLQLELAPWNIRVCHINPGFMRTALIDSTFDVTMKEFTDADTAITSQYDVAILRTFQQMVHKFMDNPSKVVDVILNNIRYEYPDLVNPVGKGVYWLYLVVALVPQSWLLYCHSMSNRFYGLGPKPEIVASIQTR